MFESIRQADVMLAAGGAGHLAPLRERPLAGPDDYPNDITSQIPLAIGSRRTGTIGEPNDQDVMVLSLTAGQSITVELSRNGTAASGALVDPYLVLLDRTGKVVAQDDDAYGDGNSRLFFTVPTTDTYYAAALDYGTGTGTYTIGAYRRNILNGSSFNDLLTGTASPDTMTMGRGNDSFSGAAGDDLLDGGEGIDVVNCSGTAGQYALGRVPIEGWSRTAAYGFVLRDSKGSEGNDLLLDVERIKFSDIWWALDLEGRAGTTVKILGALFGKESIHNLQYVGIGLSQLDGGTSVDALMNLALQARLGAKPSNTDLVNVLYTNVVGVAPNAADLKYFTDLLANGAYTQVGLVGLAAEQPLNLANIGYDDLLNFGIGYTL